MKKIWYVALLSISCSMRGDITSVDFLSAMIESTPAAVRPTLVPWLIPTWQQLSSSARDAFKNTIGAGSIAAPLKKLLEEESKGCPRAPTRAEINEIFAAVGRPLDPATETHYPNQKDLDKVLTAATAHNVNIQQLVNARNAQQATPLIVLIQLASAVQNSAELIPMISMLLEHDACVNSQDNIQTTALMYAATNAVLGKAILEKLLAYDADPTLRDFSGSTALDLAKLHINDKQSTKANVEVLEGKQKPAHKRC